MSKNQVAVIVEDDSDIRTLLGVILEQAGFRVVHAHNGAEGVEAVRVHDPLLTTMDVRMPVMDGFAAAREIRKFSDTYLIMVTALAEEVDVVAGLEAGADDYLVKPIRPRELRARADSMLRRPRERTQEPSSVDEVLAARAAARVEGPRLPPGLDPGPVPMVTDGWAQVRELELNVAQRMVRVDGEYVDLTRTEFDILASLIETGQRVRSKSDLVLAARGQEFATSYFVGEADKRALEVHIANLRRKIGDDASAPRFVETVRGVGYRIAAPR